jgi:hypothetical protein
MKLEIERRSTKNGSHETLSVARAEIISRCWHVLSYLEEMRVDLAKNIRQSAAREFAAAELVRATSCLMNAAESLVPNALAEPSNKQIRPVAESGEATT